MSLTAGMHLPFSVYAQGHEMFVGETRAVIHLILLICAKVIQLPSNYVDNVYALFFCSNFFYQFQFQHDAPENASLR